MSDSVRLTAREFSKTSVTIMSVVALAVVGMLDWATGFEISFGVFYLTPVSIAAWYAGQRWGVVFAVSSSLVWYLTELSSGYPYHHGAIPVWNAFVRFVFFLVVALLLASLRGHLRSESRLARTDALTGLMNSRAFRDRLTHDLALTERTGHPLTLVYVDLDDFKVINDTAGHNEGDRLLLVVARTLLAATRRSDTVARLGGDEFAIILPATDLPGAQSLIRDLNARLAAACAGSLPVTCSIGAAVFRELPESGDEVVAAADKLMYEAKKSGKNTLVVGTYARSKLETVRDLQAGDLTPGSGGA